MPTGYFITVNDIVLDLIRGVDLQIWFQWNYLLEKTSRLIFVFFCTFCEKQFTMARFIIPYMISTLLVGRRERRGYGIRQILSEFNSRGTKLLILKHVRNPWNLVMTRKIESKSDVRTTDHANSYIFKKRTFYIKKSH